MEEFIATTILKQKKTFYKAYDFAGDQIFGNGAEISELKNKFKKTGKLLAEGVLATRKLARQENVRTLNNQKDSRINDIKSIRSKKPEKENDKTKNPEREKVSEKTKLVQMEKEQDAKNTVEYKDLAHIIDKDERSHEKGEPSSNLENPNQEDQFHEEEKSEREMELEQIRSENEEREQDLEIDL